jgi:hypothetical protein
MSRRIRLAIYLVAVSFVLSAAACADATGPRPEDTSLCDKSNPNVCH